MTIKAIRIPYRVKHAVGLWRVQRLLKNIFSFRLLRVHELGRLPKNCNPMAHDFNHMDTPLVRGWEALHPGFDRKEDPQPLPYIILVNTRTGKQIKIHLPKD